MEGSRRALVSLELVNGTSPPEEVLNPLIINALNLRLFTIFQMSHEATYSPTLSANPAVAARMVTFVWGVARLPTA